jgi:transcriptional regulator with XRE-family HTH domain
MKPLEPIYGLIALKIRHVRETLGITQEELAKRTGYTRVSIVNIETGRQRLPLHQVEEIARALGVTTKHLLRGIWT